MPSWNTSKNRPADTRWSKYIRTEARMCQFGITCQPKERYKEDGSLDISYMDCVHFYGRRKESTRFDSQNTLSGCKGCHKYLHNHPTEHKEFMKKFLGKDFDLLTIRANTPLGMPKEFQDNNVILFCKQKEKE